MKSILRYFIPIIMIFIPETRCFGFKRFLYRRMGCVIGENTRICSSARLFPIGEMIIGRDVWIGPEAIVSSAVGCKVILEDYARIGMRVLIVTSFHEITLDGDCIEGKGTSSTVILKKGCAVSTMSIILPERTIGQMAHVAAGSVVTKDVQDFVRVAGVPAKVIRDLRETK